MRSFIEEIKEQNKIEGPKVDENTATEVLMALDYIIRYPYGKDTENICSSILRAIDNVNHVTGNLLFPIETTLHTYTKTLDKVPVEERWEAIKVIEENEERARKIRKSIDFFQNLGILIKGIDFHNGRSNMIMNAIEKAE